MPRHVLLNNVDHKDLRIVTARGARWGDAVMAAATFPAEFRNVQACYPIVFQKVTGGAGFQPLALFGFEEGENLFLDGERWDAAYLPLAVERQPFLVGFDGDAAVIHLDADSPRVGVADGEPVFLPHGGSTEYLERIGSMLQALHEGLQATPAFVEALLAHELLEPFALDIERGDGSLHRWSGFYTVNEERLRALGGAALESLHRAGHLEAAFMVLASMPHLRDLIDRAERRRKACAS
jgi:hypothetical protein